MSNPLLDRLRYHVTGAIERGEKEAIVEVRMSKHTPGPWYAVAKRDHGKPSGPYHSIEAPGYGVIVARTMATDPADREAMEADAADAHLIAAAPSLLAALSACVDSQESNGYIGVETMREARAALTSARGN